MGGVKEVKQGKGVWCYFWKLRVQIAGNLNSCVPVLFIKVHDVRTKRGALSSFPHVVLGGWGGGGTGEGPK